jgi:hypothetical protein
MNNAYFEEPYFFWQLIAVTAVIVAFMLSAALINSKKDYNKIFEETVSLLRTINKHTTTIILIKIELREKTEQLNQFKDFFKANEKTYPKI